MSRWTPEVIRRMQELGDDEADDAYRDAMAHGDIPAINRLFGSFSAERQAIAGHAPQSFLDFVAKTSALPPGTDVERATRGGTVMLEHATLSSLALLLYSLPYGYGAPRLSKVLHLTQNLEKRTYLRTLGVLQMLVNISLPDAFAAGGAAVPTAQKLRLLHAGVRHVVRKELPDYERTFGTPLSQFDLVFTLMTFSVLVIDGVERLGVKWTGQQAADYFYLWQVYGHLIGVEPEFMPRTVEEGRDFCRAYELHFADAAQNDEGVRLTRADLRMMRDLMPWWLKWLGLRPAPKIYLIRMLGKEGARRVGVKGHPGSVLLQWIVLEFPALLQRVLRALPLEGGLHAWLSRMFFRGLIEAGRGGEVKFSVPTSLRDLRRLDLSQPPRDLTKAAETLAAAEQRETTVAS